MKVCEKGKEKRKVSFWATKSTEDKISFHTKKGEKVTFYAKVLQKVKVILYARKRKKK